MPLHLKRAVLSLNLKLALIIAGVVLVFAMPTTSFAEAGFSDTGGRPYTTGSAWNDPIGSNVQLDPGSAAMVTKLRSETPVADLYDYGTPIFSADASTPRYTINCTEAWGVCNLEKQKVPIPNGAVGAPGSDGQMVIIDWSVRKAYEFWQYNNDHATTSWGDVLSIDGDGTGSTAVGAGTSRLAGVVRNFEITQRDINHALVFSTSYCQTNVFRYPATKTDGKYAGTGAVPEGARIQLDPTINVDNIPNITVGEKLVAKALQKYGAYNIDCGGASMAYVFENPIGKTDPYKGVGFTFDYFGMTHIPWDKIRVLKAWNSYTPVDQPGDGDVDGDGKVNGVDLSFLIAHKGQSYPPADFNGDGVVNGADQTILLSHWTW